MTAKHLQQRISRIAACLAALALACPTLPGPACGCGLVDVSQKCSERTGAGNSTSCSKTCCDSQAATLSKSIGSGITVTDAVNGIFQVELTPADTLAKKGSYYHEAQVTDGSSDIATVFFGILTFVEALV